MANNPNSSQQSPREGGGASISTSTSTSTASVTGIGSGEEGEQNSTSISHTLIDFTPATYISLLFTDLGVLTPAAVSDELIRLYQ